MIFRATKKEAQEHLPKEFEPYVKEWFYSRFKGLSDPQKYSFSPIHKKKNVLICAPTGSGKTLCAFLAMLNELFLLADRKELKDEIYVLYVSPLRALNNDIKRNLEAPLRGIREKAEKMGIDMPEVRSAVRTGDTPQKERSKQLKKPPHILITTPESLGIIINAPRFAEKLKSIRYVIVDEIHSLCENKRGVHLMLSLERLAHLIGKDYTRVGLSATQAPIEEIAKYLVGFPNPNTKRSRRCKVIDVSASKMMDLRVLCPAELIHTEGEQLSRSLYDTLHRLIQKHRTTLIFTNTRAGTERIIYNLKARYPKHYKKNTGAHHSSMSRDSRLEVEERLKKGELKVVITSTSLELGIDIGYIDLVIQIGSPKGIARMIQRVGRSGHKLHDTVKGRVVVVDRDDALECVVMAQCALNNQLDRVRIPTNCLDVLAQHIVGMGISQKWKVREAFNLVKKSYNYHNLDFEDFLKTLRYVAGHYASLEDQKVYGKIWYDEEAGEFGRRGRLTRMIYMTNIGTIPDEAAYKVYLRSEKGRRVGSLDEAFLDRLTRGDIFILGGSTYEFLYARGMRVYVEPRPELKPTVPAWFSEMLPLSFDLGIEIGKFNEKVQKQLEMGSLPSDVKQWIMDGYPVDESAADSLYSYLNYQYQYLGVIPTHRKILVEYYLDEHYRWNYIFHTIYGRRVNDALSRILAYILSVSTDSNVSVVVTDHGFILISGYRRVSVRSLVGELTRVELREVLKKSVRNTELMKRRFRHVASRSLMILRSYRGHQKTVGKQQMKAHFLLTACERIDPEFPLVKETYREIMEDFMDIAHCEEIVSGLKRGDIVLVDKEVEIPSPFAHNLVIQGYSDVVLMEDKRKRLLKLHEQVMRRIRAG